MKSDRSFSKVLFSEFIGGTSIAFGKKLGVIAEMIEPAGRCNLCDRECGSFQQAAAYLQPVLI